FENLLKFVFKLDLHREFGAKVYILIDTSVCRCLQKKCGFPPPQKVNFGDMFKYWGYRLDRIK
ncbi:MAG TPA: hypothetical protein O0X39_08005, partial [Methanocorpusculum sp.]|nr:hypothetical protein [Methanocorpusculum sp.]